MTIANHSISPETYNRLHSIVGNPEPYLLGEVCTYRLLEELNSTFIANLDQDYIQDYLLITNWKHFSFYNGRIIEAIRNSGHIYELSYHSFVLIWEAFNENKKELSMGKAEYYRNLRYTHIDFFIQILFLNINKWREEQSLSSLKELLYSHMELRADEYVSVRIAAKALGRFFINTKPTLLLSDTFDYIMSLQNFSCLNTSIVVYDLQIPKIKNPYKLELLFNILDKHNIDREQLFSELIENKNYPAIKYMIDHYNMHVKTDDIARILYIIEDSLIMCEEFLLTVKPIDNLKDGMRKFLSYNFLTDNFKNSFRPIVEKVISHIKYETLNKQLKQKPIDNISKQKI